MAGDKGVPVAKPQTARNNGGRVDPRIGLRIASIVVLVVLGIGVLWAIKWRIKPSHVEQMPLLDHVEELRKRILVALGIWIVGTFLAFGARFEMRDGWPLLLPAVQDNMAAQVFRRITDHLVPEGVQLIVTRPIDGFVAELYVAVMLGFALALPVMLWQLGRFVAPALNAAERRTMVYAFMPALWLFAGGVLFAWFLVLPLLLRTLYGYATELGAQPLLSISELVGFTTTMLMVFGVSFQTPLVMYVLSKTGVVASGTWMRYWRHAIVAIIIFSALVTDPTVISQAMVALPLIVLYFGGIGAARIAERRNQRT